MTSKLIAMKTPKDKRSALKIISHFLLTLLLTFLWVGCGNNGEDETTATSNPSASANQTQEEPDNTTEALADPRDNKGIGPVDHIELGQVDEAMAAEGKAIFEGNCSACHQLEERYVGPPLKEITARRTPEWIMNMIMNPTEMLEKDPIAKALLAEYLAPMANQNISQEDARKILEYFRSVNEVK
jgi:cytochrome c